MGRPAVLKIDIVADAKGVGSGVDQADSKLSKLGTIGKAAGAAVAGGLVIAGAAAVKFGVDAVKSASDVQQNFGALDTVFGKSSERVKRWAEQGADSVGLAKSEYAGLAALVGSQLQGMGVEQDKSATKSRDLIKIGADMAATYGGTVADAVSAVSSVLKGETDPIERYGVSIKAADVSARMAAMGLDGLTGKAEKQARAQATLSLLNEQTAKTTGAFARESNTLAGQQERLKAKYENVKAEIGAGLLPIATRFFTFLSDKLLPGGQRLYHQLTDDLGPGFRRVGGFVDDVSGAVRGVIGWCVDHLVPMIRKTLSPILGGLADAWREIANKIQDNRPQIQAVIDVFRRWAEFMADRVLPMLGPILGDAVRGAGKVIGGLIDGVGFLIGGFQDVVGAIQNVINWLGRLKVPDIPGLSKLLGLVGGSAPLTFGVVELAGRAPAYGPSGGGLSTAALGDGPTWSAVSSGQLRAGVVQYVDARDLSVSVQLPPNPLGLFDEAAAARQLGALLERHAVRIGQAPTFGTVVAP